MALHHVVLEEFAKSLQECGLVDITFRTKDGGFQTFNIKQVADSIVAVLLANVAQHTNILPGLGIPPILPPGR